MTSDNTLTNDSAQLPKYQPVDTDKLPFQWDGNRATITAMLSQTNKFFKRTGLFDTFFKHHAVPLYNGKLAVDSPTSVKYFTATTVYKDVRSFDDPAPPTPARLEATNAARKANVNDQTGLEDPLPELARGNRRERGRAARGG